MTQNKFRLRAVPMGKIVKKENGEYETVPLTLKEKMEMQDALDRGVNTPLPREKWEELTKDEKFVEYADKFFKEMKAKGEIPNACGKGCRGNCCSDLDHIGEPNVSEYEVDRIAKHTGLHVECFTKYIIPAEKLVGLWKSFYLEPIRVIKRIGDPCLFLSENELKCLKYNRACLMKNNEYLPAQ